MEIDPREVEATTGDGCTIRHKILQNGMAAFYGPWLKNKEGQPRYFDTYTEALYANINYKREQDFKSQGLNQYGQTPEQEKAFKERQKEANLMKQKARIADQMLVQSGAK